MDITVALALVTIIGTVCGIAGYLLMRHKFLKELEVGKRREDELARRAYETAVLKEIGERIGYSLDAFKIVEIISGSLGRLLPYSTVSFMILDKVKERIRFDCHLKETVNRRFVQQVKTKMLAAFSEMLQETVLDIDVDEGISGAILDEGEVSEILSFFNLPIVVSGKVVGLINVASKFPNVYRDENTEVLYRIARQASEAVSKLQEVLESEKGKLLQAVESLSDGVLMVDTRYQLILANRRLRSLLSVRDDPKIFDIVNALAGSFDLRTKMEEAMARDSLAAQEIKIGDKVLEVSVAKVLDRRHDKPMGAVVLFHDITDRKSLEKLRSDFTAMMVHELRAPLTSIKSTVEILKDSAGQSQELSRSLELVDSTSQTMLELVNDLLDVAKIEAGKFDVICDSGELGQIISERAESFKGLAASKNLKLSVGVEENLPRAWFDKVRIKQVLNNLISNAIKYTQSGEVRIKAAKEIVNGIPVDILVSVKDTGIGIDQEEIGELFSRFGQLTAGRSKAGGASSGLGLYIARGIVEASGGKIGVKSEGPGTGSTFYFTVLLADSVVKNKSKVFEGSARNFLIN